MPEINVIYAALIAGAFGASIVLLIVGLRGVEVDIVSTSIVPSPDTP